MSDINQNVNINVNANTQDAGQDINKLENNIKTLDGAVNLVGGSIEVLAGSLALTGAVTEEQAEKFQTAAIGAIALADGSKRLLEGYRTLVTETNFVAKAQKALNFILRANPLGLVFTAVTLLAGGYLLLRNRTDASTEAAKRSRDARIAELDAIDNVAAANLRLARAQGASEEEIKQAEIDSIERNIERISLQRQQLQNEGGISKGVKKNREEIKALGAQQREQRVQLAAAEAELQTIRDNNATKEEDNRKKAAADAQREADLTIVRTDKLAMKTANFEEGKRKESNLTLRTIDANQQRETAIAEQEAAKRGKIFQAEQEYKDKLLTEGVDNLQGALGALFAENKAVASANVLIDAAQAGVGIIKNSQTTGPFAIAYQATQFALLAATTVASLRQINSAEPGSSGTPNTPTSSGLPTTGGTQTFGSGGRPQIGRGSSGVTAINAVVLSGEMTSAQAQDAALRNRRRFGGG